MGVVQRVLLRCDSNVDQFQYQRILSDALPQIYSTRYFFQQDRASCHTARTTKAYLENKMIRMLPNWLPQSPDISIIGNVWNSVKQLIANRDISTCEQLWTAVKEEWDHLSNDFITNLYESLQKT